MASETLIKMQQALTKLVNRPLEETIAELKIIASADKKNPAPHLAMVIVSGFTEFNFNESKNYLANAEKLLREGGAEGDAEWEFSQNLYQVIKNEFRLLELREERTKQGGSKVEDLEESFNIAYEVRSALMNMDKLKPQLKGFPIIAIILAMLHTLSLTSNRGSREYLSGMKGLSKLFEKKKDLKDVAGFFLMYGYRKGKDYKNAIKIGVELEKRNPRSVMIKKALGGAFNLIGSYEEAAKYYKEALRLAPMDPGTPLGYANILNKMGNFDESKAMIQKTIGLDIQKKYTSRIREINGIIKIRERNYEKIKEIGWA